MTARIAGHPVTRYQDARDALAATIRAVFPDARPARGWTGIETWAAPRPAAAVARASTGTYDPAAIVIGIADRKVGPTVYFLDPGDYFALETHRALLEAAGLKLGRGCIMHTRKAPLPVDALEALFRRVKARDEAAAAAPATSARAPRPKAPASVDAYLQALPPRQRMALERLRKLIRAAAPRATETLAYGMPTFVHEGNLVHFAAFKEHCSLFPGSGTLTKRLAAELEGFVTAKGTIRFAPHKPLPAALVKRIVRLRVEENEARAAARKAKRAKKARPARKATKKAAKRAKAKR